MPKIKEKIYSRIGTCRSGIPFDVPYEVEAKDLDDIVNKLSIADLVDIFCMTEAFFNRYYDNLENLKEYQSIKAINGHLRRQELMGFLANELTSLNLFASPNYVRHGLFLLLVK
jgi:hypothetical protein